MITLSRFKIDPQFGYLPLQDPLDALPLQFKAWDDTARHLPKLLVSTRTRSTVDALPLLDASKLKDGPELERAMAVLSYIGHAYVWSGPKPAAALPKPLAIPWYEISQRLGRPPVLSYASYALHNWQRIDPNGPIENGNIALLLNFFGGADEEWFVLVHVDIERRCAPAIEGAAEAHNAAEQGDAKKLQAALEKIAASLSDAYAGLERMTEFCDPYIYYHRVRPYIHGWKNHPLLTQGVAYEGVTAYQGKPQQFRGETGAQSSIIPALDAVLGIAHQDDPLRPYLLEMQDYMPPDHRGFIRALEKGPSARPLVMRLKDKEAGLRAAYNDCIEWVQKFRSLHLQYAAEYIFKQSQTSPSNPSAVGTGGTPFMPYLTKHRDETASHKV